MIPRYPSLPLHRTRSSDASYPPAAIALGPAHPLTRAAQARALLGGQLAMTSVLLIVAVAGALSRGGVAITIASAALVVEAALACGFAGACTCARERARDVIASGDGDLQVAEIAAERARLARPAHRERLASSLERALYGAEHWHELWVPTRPPPAVRNLLGCPELTRDVAQLVRDARTSAHGLALLDRVVCGGYAATLYAGSAEVVEQELTRVRFLLTTGPPNPGSASESSLQLTHRSVP